MKQSTLRNARGGTGLEDVPFALTEAEQNQAKEFAAEQLARMKEESRTDEPETVPVIRVEPMTKIARFMDDLPANAQADMLYGVYDLMGDDYLDYQRSIHDGVSNAFWFDAVQPESF